MTSAPEGSDSAAEGHDRQSRAPILIIAGAVVLTVAVIAAVVVLAVNARHRAAAPDTGPLPVAAAPAPGGSGRYCTDLLPALPDRLGTAPRRAIADAQPGVAAWGDPPVILRCGLPDPSELTCSAQLTQFTDAAGGSVAWLRLSDSSAVTYLAVDRPVRIAVTLPPGAGPAPIQQLTETIAATLPVRPICRDGAVVPPDNA